MPNIPLDFAPSMDLALAAFCRGDRLGAPWESNGTNLRTVSIEDIRARARTYPQGTDESDIVRCWLLFLTGFSGLPVDDLCLAWCDFHTREHRPTTYGRTWRDHFATIAHLRRHGDFTLEKVLSISADRNSFGNGLLSLVYPVFRFARARGDDSATMVEAFGRLTHDHPTARGAARALHDLLADLVVGRDPLAHEPDRTLSPAEFVARYPSNVPAAMLLRHARYHAARATTEDELLCACIGMGGDVDSVLAIALLLFTLRTTGGAAFNGDIAAPTTIP